MLLRSMRAVGAYNPYVRGGLITAASLAAARAGLRKARRIKMKGRIGFPKGTATSKRAATVTNTGDPLSTRTLYYENLVNIAKTSTNEIDKRQRDNAYISGFKICYDVLNYSVNPVLLNVAVVYDKRSNDGTVIMALDDFFRSSEGNNRAKDFSITLDANEFHCLPLNTDRFSVLKHGRFTLGPTQSATVGAYTVNRENYKSIMWWVPLKKQIRYNDGNAQSKVWLIWWCDKFQAGTGVAAVTIGQTQIHAVTYFKEPKGA